jgi:flagellar motor switch protein FliN/FliY
MGDTTKNAQDETLDTTGGKSKKQEGPPAVSTDGSNPEKQGGQRHQGIDFLLDVPLQVSVEVGRTRMLIKDFLQMKEGGVIELDKLADEPLDLYVNSQLIARGEAVVVNDKFGLRLIDVVSPSERLEKLR